MAQQEKIRLMTRLAILEKQHGKQIRRVENAFRIDLLTNPVWKMGFFASLACAVIAGILMALNINMFLDAFASGQLKSLIMIVLIAYGSILLITIIIAAIRSYASYRKSLYYQRQYHSLLEKIRRFDQERGGGSRYASGPGSGSRYNSGPGADSSRYAGGNGRRPSDEDDDWEDEDVRRDVPKGKRKREDLDYRRMETLEFEDDEYSYYVEATPKRGGR